MIEASIQSMVGEFRERRDACLAVLAEEPRIECVRPDGAFYLFLKVGGDATEFATRLLEDHGVAVVPGAAFMAPGWIRMSYATRQALAVEGVRRIVALWRSLHHG
jgi:aspartate aminotransferase